MVVRGRARPFPVVLSACRRGLAHGPLARGELLASGGGCSSVHAASVSFSFKRPRLKGATTA
eukprot:1289609-Alexandrium_andersonii.AAC.1